MDKSGRAILDTLKSREKGGRRSIQNRVVVVEARGHKGAPIVSSIV